MIQSSTADVFGEFDTIIQNTQSRRAIVVHSTRGICECCNATIPVGRLKAAPSATLCVACQSEQDEAG